MDARNDRPPTLARQSLPVEEEIKTVLIADHMPALDDMYTSTGVSSHTPVSTWSTLPMRRLDSDIPDQTLLPLIVSTVKIPRPSEHHTPPPEFFSLDPRNNLTLWNVKGNGGHRVDFVFELAYPPEVFCESTTETLMIRQSERGNWNTRLITDPDGNVRQVCLVPLQISRVGTKKTAGTLYFCFGGHEQVLKWAREHGLPYDETLFSEALHRRHPEALKWLSDNGNPLPLTRSYCSINVVISSDKKYHMKSWLRRATLNSDPLAYDGEEISTRYASEDDVRRYTPETLFERVVDAYLKLSSVAMAKACDEPVYGTAVDVLAGCLHATPEFASATRKEYLKADLRDRVSKKGLNEGVMEFIDIRMECLKTKLIVCRPLHERFPRMNSVTFNRLIWDVSNSAQAEEVLNYVRMQIGCDRLILLRIRTSSPGNLVISTLEKHYNVSDSHRLFMDYILHEQQFDYLLFDDGNEIKFEAKSDFLFQSDRARFEADPAFWKLIRYPQITFESGATTVAASVPGHTPSYDTHMTEISPGDDLDEFFG